MASVAASSAAASSSSNITEQNAIDILIAIKDSLQFHEKNIYVKEYFNNSQELFLAITFLFAHISTGNVKTLLLENLIDVIKSSRHANTTPYLNGVLEMLETNKFNIIKPNMDSLQNIQPYRDVIIERALQFKLWIQPLLASQVGSVPPGMTLHTLPRPYVRNPSFNDTQPIFSNENATLKAFMDAIADMHFGTPAYNAAFIDGFKNEQIAEKLKKLVSGASKVEYTKLFDIFYDADLNLIPISIELVEKPNGFLIYLWYVFEWLMSYVDTLHDHEENSKKVIGTLCISDFVELLTTMDTAFAAKTTKSRLPLANLKEFANKKIQDINHACYSGDSVNQKGCKVQLSKLCDEWLEWICDPEKMPTGQVVDYLHKSSAVACLGAFQFNKSISPNNDEKNTKAARACYDAAKERGVSYLMIDSQFSGESSRKVRAVESSSHGIKFLCTNATAWDAACTSSNVNTNVERCIAERCPSANSKRVRRIPPARILGCVIKISDDGKEITSSLERDQRYSVTLLNGPHSLSIGSISQLNGDAPPRSETARGFNDKFVINVSDKLKDLIESAKDREKGIQIRKLLIGSFKGATDKLQGLAALQLSKTTKTQTALETIDLCFLPWLIASGVENIFVNTQNRQLIYYATNTHASETTRVQDFIHKKENMISMIGFLKGTVIPPRSDYSNNLKDYVKRWFDNLNEICTTLQNSNNPMTFWSMYGIKNSIPNYREMAEKEIKRLERVSALLDKENPNDDEKKEIESVIMSMPTTLAPFMTNLLSSRQINAELSENHAKLFKIREDIDSFINTKKTPHPYETFRLLCGKLDNIVNDSCYKITNTPQIREKEIRLQTACTIVAFCNKLGKNHTILTEWLHTIQHTALDNALVIAANAVSVKNIELSSVNTYKSDCLLSNNLLRGNNNVKALNILKVINGNKSLLCATVLNQLFEVEPHFKYIMEMSSMIYLCSSYASSVYKERSAEAVTLNAKPPKKGVDLNTLRTSDYESWSSLFAVNNKAYGLEEIRGFGFGDFVVEANDVLERGLREQVMNDRDVQLIFMEYHINGNERRLILSQQLERIKAQPHAVRIYPNAAYVSRHPEAENTDAMLCGNSGCTSSLQLHKSFSFPGPIAPPHPRLTRSLSMPASLALQIPAALSFESLAPFTMKSEKRRLGNISTTSHNNSTAVRVSVKAHRTGAAATSNGMINNTSANRFAPPQLAVLPQPAVLPQLDPAWLRKVKSNAFREVVSLDELVELLAVHTSNTEPTAMPPPTVLGMTRSSNNAGLSPHNTTHSSSNNPKLKLNNDADINGGGTKKRKSQTRKHQKHKCQTHKRQQRKRKTCNRKARKTRKN